MIAAMKVISLHEPPLQKDNPNPNLTQWLNHIRLSRNAIESILELKSSSGLVLKARYIIYFGVELQVISLILLYILLLFNVALGAYMSTASIVLVALYLVFSVLH